MKTLPVRLFALFAFFVVVLALGKLLNPRPRNSLALRENPGGLLPHAQKRVSECISNLRRESFDESVRIYEAGGDCCNRVYHDGKFGYKETDYINVISNRRTHKLLNDISQMPAASRDEVCRSTFNTILKHYEARHLSRVIVPIEGSIAGRQALSYGLLATAEFGTVQSLLELLDSLEKSKSWYSKLCEDSRSGANWERRIRNMVEFNYPERRSIMNVILLTLQHAGFTAEHRMLSQGLRKELVPMEKWDGPVNVFDGNRMSIFANSSEYPAYVDLKKGWKEYFIYDWPESWTDIRSRELKVDEWLKTAMDTMRSIALRPKR